MKTPFHLGLVGWILFVVVVRVLARYAVRQGHFADVLTALFVAVFAFMIARSSGWISQHGLDGRGVVALLVGAATGYGAFHLIRRPPSDDGAPHHPRRRRHADSVDE